MTLSLDKIYQETRADIRATDEISFKLMGLVPLAAAVATFLTSFLEEKAKDHPNVVVALSLFSALITLGLFRWELRNIQICNWLLQRSEAMVEETTHSKLARPKPPWGVGKTEAEKAVYSLTIITWLLMPIAVHAVKLSGDWSLYWVVAVIIAGVTGWSAFTSVRVGGEGEKYIRK
jgi:hypothetical protein